MKRIFPIDSLTFARRVLALVGCAAALASLTVVPAAAQGPTDEEYQALENRLVELVNEERLKVGIDPLVRSDKLDHAAWRYSWDMALNGAWNHLGSDNRWTEDRIADEGYLFSRFGENIFAGAGTPEEAMAWWKTSPGHWANILDPQFTEIGVALAYTPDTEAHYYWTQVFARPR